LNLQYRKNIWRNWNDGDGGNNWGTAPPDPNWNLNTFVRDSNGMARVATFGSNTMSGYLEKQALKVLELTMVRLIQV
jgi:hypothetical protein